MLVTKLSQTAASRRETSQAFLDSNCASDSSLNHCRKPIDTKECGLNEDNCFKAPSPTYTFPKAHRASTKSFSAVSKPCNPKTPVKTSNPCNPKNTPKQASALESSSSALLRKGDPTKRWVVHRVINMPSTEHCPVNEQPFLHQFSFWSRIFRKSHHVLM
jgi:hypothetical protein